MVLPVETVRVAWRWLVVAISLATAGCSDGEVRHQISGTVTYQGKPVEHGAIAFEPEASVGPDFAPSTYAHIENGKYTTDRDKSPTTGRYKVRVSAFDMEQMKAKAVPGEPLDPIALFPPYLATIDIPPPDGTFDVEVPADARPPAGQ